MPDKPFIIKLSELPKQVEKPAYFYFIEYINVILYIVAAGLIGVGVFSILFSAHPNSYYMYGRPSLTQYIHHNMFSFISLGLFFLAMPRVLKKMCLKIFIRHSLKRFVFNNEGKPLPETLDLVWGVSDDDDFIVINQAVPSKNDA